MKIKHELPWIAVSLAGLLGVLSALPLACSKGNPREPLETAIITYSHAMLTGDENAAWDLLSERCRGRIGRKDIGGVSDILTDRYRDETPQHIYFETPQHERVTGALPDSVYAFYSFPSQVDLGQSGEPWTLENGAWRNDEC